MARNRARAGRNNTRHDYLLRSLLVCGQCGRRMVGCWSNNGGRYMCSARYLRHEPWACDGRSIQAIRLEPLSRDYVRGLLADPALLKARYADGCGDPAVDGREEQERDRLARKVQGLEREVQRLIDAYQAGVIDLVELQERRRRIDEHGGLLRERIDEIVTQRATREQELQLLEGVEDFCVSVRDGLEEASFTGKQRVFQVVVDRIVVKETRVVVHHVVPTGPVRLQTGQNRSKRPIGARCVAQRRTLCGRNLNRRYWWRPRLQGGACA